MRSVGSLGSVGSVGVLESVGGEASVGSVGRNRSSPLSPLSSLSSLSSEGLTPLSPCLPYLPPLPLTERDTAYLSGIQFKPKIKLIIERWFPKAGYEAKKLLRNLKLKADQWWYFLAHPEIPPDNNARRTFFEIGSH